MDSVNFVGWISRHFQPNSSFVNAANGQVFLGLKSYVCAAANSFIEHGFAPGSRVVIACRQDPETALAILGAIYAGLVVVPVDGNNHAAIKNLLMLTGAVALWSGSINDSSLADTCAFLCGHPTPSGDIFHAIECDRNDLAALMPTSGTTGNPRLVMVTHENLIANTTAIIHSQGLSMGDSAMLILPLSYCFGASVLYSHLAVGGSVVFDRRFMFPDKVLQAMVDYDCATFAGVPSVFNILLSRSSLGKIGLPALRRVLQAGGRLGPEQIDEFLHRLPGVDFHVMYGQTEATSRITSLAPEYITSHRGSVGKALDNLCLRVVDGHRRDLPPMEVGNIEIAGPSVCAGYWNDAESSKLRFADGWLLTGDRGWVDAEGFLWIEGRNDDFLKIRGRRISFTEIESAVRDVKGVHEVAVLSVTDTEAGEVPVVFVVSENIDSDAVLIDKILRIMPVAWTCRQVVVLPNFPLTSNGKLDRKALRSAIG
ncbi:MAG TPA: AMP-binding protein [Eoetvoesiella sp.]